MKLEQLKAQRDTLCQHLQALIDTPQDQRPTAPKELKAWLSDLETHSRLVEQIEQFIARLERPAPDPIEPMPAAAEFQVIARIKKTSRTEARVCLKLWKGRRHIDVRDWSLIGNGSEYYPKKSGIQIRVGKLPELIGALQLAAQYV